jgi:6-phosphogluconolactonase
MKGHLEIFQSSTALLYGAAEKILTCLREELLVHGTASLVLSGGTTPRGVYELIGSEKYRDRVDWKRIHLFWGDERCVPPTMPESNYRMAHRAFIKNIPIPSHHVHRIHGELRPQEAARAYEMDIRNFFSLKKGELPRWTLVLLGLGEDGHTGSLFPDTGVLDEKERLVSEVYVDSLASYRVTMTLPAINNAATVLFLVSGRTKAVILREVLEDGGADYPARRISPVSGRLFWFADYEAASQYEEGGTS